MQRRTRSRALAPLTVLALTGSTLAVGFSAPAQANPAGTGLVISEAYGGGGNSGATLTNDFVEIYNPTAQPVDVDGWSIQYRSAGGSAAPQVTELSGEVPAGGFYLVQQAAGNAGTDPLPGADATGTIAMGGSGFQVWLADTTTPLTPPAGDVTAAPVAGVVDFLGSSSGAVSYEGSGPAPAPSNTTSVARSATGADTDVNAADFGAGAPTPTNAAGETGGEEPPPTGPGDEVTIAEIQGEGASSPLDGDVVTTQGVVTGLWPTAAGLDGFTIQTGGTGESAGAASDGVFVESTGAFDESTLSLGDSVEVTGTVDENFGLTAVEATAVSVLAAEDALDAVTPLETAYPTTDAGREAVESMLVAPTDTLTVTNTYSIDGGGNAFAEIGLATGTTPLLQPTDVEDFQTGDIAGVKADNAARGVVLDDGSNTNYAQGAGQDLTLPWLSAENAPRVGAEATLEQPVVMSYGFGKWRFQPQERVVDEGTDVVTFEDTRAANAAPQPVGGDLTLATFNVLNYFTTTGQEFVAAGEGRTCTYFNDRDGNPIANNRCNPDGPRGAATDASLERQQAKIVTAINALDADIVSLEELENSVKMPGTESRDDAIAELVDALNAADGGTEPRWAFVPSPDASELPPLAQQDVIRTGFIYDPASVTAVGASDVLVDDAFLNARQPLAQVFKAVGDADADGFAVVVNHFKSKGDSNPPATGDNANGDQGAFNGDRVRQAQALVEFVEDFKTARGVTRSFLTGDFNAYTEEDPVQVLEEAGYTNLESDEEGDYSYSFNGLSGSLDHVFADAGAFALVTGVDVWDINASESPAYQYSRFNYHPNELFDGSEPFAASDHNPELVGFDIPVDADQTRINLLNINDFHGRIDENTTKFATTVERLRARAGEDNTLFLSAGDNIGASLFASSLAEDNPTIDVLNALDLATSAVGNHEFDRGAEDLFGRVEDRADFSYLGANVYDKGTETPAMQEYATFEVGEVTVGVIGAITQETPSLVSPAGIADLDFGDPVEAVNRVADQLSDGDEANGEADVLVAEFHEGASAGTPDGSTPEEEIAAGGVFAEIATETSAEVDAIFTGHTHKEYAWNIPVPGEAGRTRPVLQTGSYGENIGQIVLTVDSATGEVEAYRQRNVARAATENLAFPRVAEVKEITDAALAEAEEIGNQPVGEITADITTAYSGGRRDDRAAESTLGGLVANALRDGVADFADPDLGLTNPGGLRADLLFDGDTESNPLDENGVVTFAEANAVLPFNNTVAIVEMTGAQIKEVLEQQWQTNADGTVPQRPYLQLGMSDNVQVTADATRPRGDRITSVRIDGEPLDAAASYTVSTLSFLAQGGDNFRAFTEGDTVDTGLLDGEMWRDYLTDNKPLTPSFARRQVFASDLPTPAPAGGQVSMVLGPRYTAPAAPITGTTLDLTSLGSPANSTVVATGFTGAEGATEVALGEFPVTDGRAPVSFRVPASMQPGDRIELVAQPSGTTVTLEVGAAEPGGPGEPGAKASAKIGVKVTPQRVRVDRTRPKVAVLVLSEDKRATGFVRINVTGSKPVVRKLVNGRVVIRTGPFAQPGAKKVFVRYNGNATTKARTVGKTFRVTR